MCVCGGGDNNRRNREHEFEIVEDGDMGRVGRKKGKKENDVTIF